MSVVAFIIFILTTCCCDDVFNIWGYIDILLKLITRKLKLHMGLIFYGVVLVWRYRE